MPSFTVENYIKAIFHLSRATEGGVSTNAIAEAIGTRAATVSDMLKKLAAQELVSYKKYQGTELTEKGQKMAIHIIRKHRLWEVFLMDTLGFRWDEVHDIAEELEHIPSDKLVNRLEEFLGYPKFDPHGDPIPDRDGNIHRRVQVPLLDLKPGETGQISSVKDSSKAFLQYLDAQQIKLNDKLKVLEIYDFDQTHIVQLNDRQLTMSPLVCENLFVIQD